MTYKEIKERLTQCEKSLLKIKASSSTLPAAKLTQVNKLQVLKESLTRQLKESQSKTYLVTPKSGQTTAVSLGDDEKDALSDADDVKAIKGIDGETVKERLNKNTGTVYTVEETKIIAKQVGKAVASALKTLGDELSSMKAKHIEENSFEIYVEYKRNGNDDEFAFHVVNDKLHIADFTFNKIIGEIGTKPSGEPIIQDEVLANELVKHWRSLQETMSDDEFQAAKEADRLEDHPEKNVIKKIQALLAKERSANEDKYDDMADADSDIPKDRKKDTALAYRKVDKGASYKNAISHVKNLKEGENKHYIKVTSSDYKAAMSILDEMIDPTYVKMEVSDDDGAGNVIIYFIFKHESGFDDMYDDSENQDSEFYQEPDEDPNAFMYDMIMDLAARGVDIVATSHDHDMEEATDLNDPVVMKQRAMMSTWKDRKELGKMKKSKGINPLYKQAQKDAKMGGILRKLKAKRAQVMRDMEQEAEPQGGPISDKYGDVLNRIDTAIDKATKGKTVHYDDRDVDTSTNESFDDDSLFTFGFDLDEIQYVVDYLKANYSEQDYELHVGRGDTHPNSVTLHNPEMENDAQLGDLLDGAKGSDQTDYEDYRREEDDYANNELEESEEEAPEGGPDQGGDLDIGHQDDEPDMLLKDLYDIAHYAAKLHQRMKKYAAHDGEVDFPHWWQKKVTLAREYISSAQHYLEAEENQPAMDQLALEHVVKEVGINKLQKEYDILIGTMKDLAKRYKEGDKSVVDTLKGHTKRKRELEQHLVDKVSGSGRDQQLSNVDETTLNESASQDLDEIFGALGYRQGFDEFIEDNPGAVEVLMDWIGSISDFRATLSNEFSREEQEQLGFYYGDDDEDEYNESTVKEGRGDLETITRVVEDMAAEDGTSVEEAAEEIIHVLRITYGLDAMDESVNENLNPEVSKKVNQFIKAMAKRYGYDEQDAVFAIKQALRLRGMGKEDAAELDENKLLKEFTDQSFKGSELIDKVNKEAPDMFGKQIFADLLPKGVASENDAIKALKAHDKSPIKDRMGRYAPMFVHVQYHNLEHEGEDYRIHQTQYYNNNFKDKDPSFNPRVTEVTIFHITKKAEDRRDSEEKKKLGTILVKTGEYILDLNALDGLGKQVSEEVNEVVTTMSSFIRKHRDAVVKHIQGKLEDDMGTQEVAIEYLDYSKEEASDADGTVYADAAEAIVDDPEIATEFIDYGDMKQIRMASGVSEATRQDLGMVSSISKRRAKAHLKNPSKDGSTVYGLDKDGKRVSIKSINDVDKFTKFEIDADLNEVIKEEATCCGKCGRVHVKGNCKRPYLKGAKHCRTK
jgi:hypothetical protein